MVDNIYPKVDADDNNDNNCEFWELHHFQQMFYTTVNISGFIQCFIDLAHIYIIYMKYKRYAIILLLACLFSMAANICFLYEIISNKQNQNVTDISQTEYFCFERVSKIRSGHPNCVHSTPNCDQIELGSKPLSDFILDIDNTIYCKKCMSQLQIDSIREIIYDNINSN